MEPAIKVAIGALTISFFSLIVAVISSVYTAKTYKKNRRLEFLQRRDHLSQKISDLNESNTETRLISARYELVTVRNIGLSLPGELAERNTAQIASIKEQREEIQKQINLCHEVIEKAHFLYSNLTLETDAPKVERVITAVQVASDNHKKANSSYSSILHIIETTSELIKADLAEMEEKIRQSNLDFERAAEELMNEPKSED